MTWKISPIIRNILARIEGTFVFFKEDVISIILIISNISVT